MEHEHSVFDRLTAAFSAGSIPYTTKHHDAVYTSAEAAAARGSTLHSGAKALIIKCGDDFYMIVLPADLALDTKAVTELLNSKRLRFASKEEVLELTGLTPGSIPPF